MNKFKDLTNLKFDKWKVSHRVENGKNGSARWHCICECGKEKEIYTSSLTSGKSKSCGCSNYKNLKITQPTHGMTGTKIYEAWTHLRSRCKNSKDKNYKNYGGRGITVCKEWNKFENFQEWSNKHGFKDGLSIDRIDNNGNYEPSNCRWTTSKVQQNNTRHNRKLTIKGETKNFLEWCRFIKIDPKTMYYRLKNNWSDERLLKPSKQREVIK